MFKKKLLLKPVYKKEGKDQLKLYNHVCALNSLIWQSQLYDRLLQDNF